MSTSQESSNQTISEINAADVLSGRGGKTNSHNRVYRALIKENRPTYQNMKDHTHKQFLAESIIASVKARGGRFLKRYGREGNLWVELSTEEALIKTTQALREIPSGTSSRALNVERLLERNREKKVLEILESIDLQPLPLETCPKEEKISISSFTRCSMNPVEFEDSSEQCDDMLDGNELETLMSDKDGFNALLSLLD